MKISTRFVLAMSILCALLSVISGAAIHWSISLARESDNRAVASVIALVKEKYPDADDHEIALILNGKSSMDGAEELMKKYGIGMDGSIVMTRNDGYTVAMLTGTGCCILTGVMSVLFFLLYLKYQKRQEKKLAAYLERINNGDYRLPFDRLTEDETSILASEIYRTTVMLREQKENSINDKVKLKDSLSDISHQLKTPITSMVIMLDNIMEGDMPEELRNEFLCDIKSSVEHLSFLTRSLLTLSKLDANTVEYHKRDGRFRELIEFGIGSTSAIAAERGVEVRGVDGDFDFCCDYRWVSEAVTNIVKNCIEHTQKGGQVTLTADDTPLFSRLVIEDNGCGIDSADLPHIFERFYKGKNSDENSVGIGLALSKIIIEQCGGYISVSSEPGKGSRFTIKFFKTAPKGHDEKAEDELSEE